MIAVPVTIKIFGIFGFILCLTRMKVPLSFSLFAGSFLLGLWMDLGATALLKSVFESLTALQTIILMLIVGSILIMSRLMEETGHLDRIVGSFDSISGDGRVTGLVMPALIGLLPMPGGALFSAPMVDRALCEHPLSGEAKTAVNYWFRHIWEYWWPLYPGVVLAVALLGVESWLFMVFMAPLTIITLLTGVLFIMRPLGKGCMAKKGPLPRKGVRHFLWEIMPIWIVIVTIAVFAGLTEFLKIQGVPLKLPGGVSILPGLVASAVWVGFVNRASPGQLRSALLNKGILPMLLLIAGIMVFKGVMTDSNAVTEIRNELVAYGIPAGLIILFMPFLSGVITGIAIGFVGTSFPVVAPMFPTADTYHYLLWAGLAYTFGYMGMMLSPVHLCFLVTKDYFKAGFLECYRYILLPVLVVMLTALGLFMVLIRL